MEGMDDREMGLVEGISEKEERRAAYLTLMGMFLTLFGLVARREKRDQKAPKPRDLALLGLATYRAGRLVAYDQVMEPLRSPFTKTEPDESGAGMAVVPQGGGARRALGELISCPVCVGTWIAAVLVYGTRLLPGPTRLLLTILAVSGVAEWLDAAVEAMKWRSEAARKEVGA
jgi:hypothetical protein